MVDEDFRARFWENEPPRPNDERDEYQRDKARVIHSSAFRRLQAKTQVMGVGEGDFHRTRLTHSIEVGQIAEGLLESLKLRYGSDKEVCSWLPSRDLLMGACLAHDIGHPPFGHAGERALHTRMVDHGGFEGNAQTLRIITRLDKYKFGKGMNPTRRFILAVLKYPFIYSEYTLGDYRHKPPKCYYDSEKEIVNWAMREAPIGSYEVDRFYARKGGNGGKETYTLDCSILEYADDIAYGVHDLEDIVARRMVDAEEVTEKLTPIFEKHGMRIGSGQGSIVLSDFENLFKEHHVRKAVVGKLVNLFVTSVKIRRRREFSHPLIVLQTDFKEPVKDLLNILRELTYELVIQKAEIQQLERRGKRIICQLFEDLLEDPEKLIPRHTWRAYNEKDSRERRVCDYISSVPFEKCVQLGRVGDSGER